MSDRPAAFSGASEPERVARICAMAEEVWENPDLAREFLETPQPALDGFRPLELMSTEAGFQRVEALLMKIEHALPV